MSNRVFGTSGLGRIAGWLACAGCLALASESGAVILAAIEFQPTPPLGTPALDADELQTAFGIMGPVFTTGSIVPVGAGGMAPGGVDGGATALRLDANSDSAFRAQLTDPIGNVASEDTIWISAIIKPEGGFAGINEFFGVWLDTTATGTHSANRPNIGIKTNSANADGYFGRLSTNAVNTVEPVLNPVAGTPIHLVMRVSKVASTNYNQIEVWVDPAAGPTPPVFSEGVKSGNGGTNLTFIGLRTANFVSGTSVLVDRIVVATEYPDIFTSNNNPLFVSLESFTATGYAGGPVTVRWQTSTEIDNAGFHVYRATETGMQRLTSTLLAPLGDEFTGASYEFLDRGARSFTTMPQYYLEDVELDGTATMHGPAEQILLAPPSPVSPVQGPIRVGDGKDGRFQTQAPVSVSPVRGGETRTR